MVGARVGVQNARTNVQDRAGLRIRTIVRLQMPEPKVKTESEPEIRAKGQNQITWSQGRHKQGRFQGESKAGTGLKQGEVQGRVEAMGRAEADLGARLAHGGRKSAGM